MCWQCDQPGATWDGYIEWVRGILDEHCWIVQGVEPDKHRPPYAYTVGLTGHDRPELVVTGMRYERAAVVLDGMAAHLLHAEPPAPGEVMRLTGGPTVEIVLVAAPSVHLLVAAACYWTEISALQLAYADDRGRWPWERGFRGGRGGQPVLGARAGRTRRSARAA
jgi:hypothetical protein